MRGILVLPVVVFINQTCLAQTTASPLSPPTPPPPPCATDAHRGFDFWLGEWNVIGRNGKQVGTNRIEKDYRDCVLRERYDTGQGYRGESFNVYDASRQVWHQTWVDSSGTLLLLEGGLRDGTMVLEGTTGAAARSQRHRISWTPHPDG